MDSSMGVVWSWAVVSFYLDRVHQPAGAGTVVSVSAELRHSRNPPPNRAQNRTSIFCYGTWLAEAFWFEPFELNGIYALA